MWIVGIDRNQEVKLIQRYTFTLIIFICGNIWMNIKYKYNNILGIVISNAVSFSCFLFAFIYLKPKGHICAVCTVQFVIAFSNFLSLFAGDLLHFHCFRFFVLYLKIFRLNNYILKGSGGINLIVRTELKRLWHNSSTVLCFVFWWQKCYFYNLLFEMKILIALCLLCFF